MSSLGRFCPPIPQPGGPRAHPQHNFLIRTGSERKRTLASCCNGQMGGWRGTRDKGQRGSVAAGYLMKDTNRKSIISNGDASQEVHYAGYTSKPVTALPTLANDVCRLIVLIVGRSDSRLHSPSGGQVFNLYNGTRQRSMELWEWMLPVSCFLLLKMASRSVAWLVLCCLLPVL